MGNNFSSRRDIYLHQYRNPRVSEKSYKLMIRLTPSGFRPSALPFAQLVSDKDAGQYAIITGIYLLFVNNESAEEYRPLLRGLFPATEEKNEDVQHTDDSGKLTIICPAQFNGPVEGNDGLLYKPRLTFDKLMNYAGLEQAFSHSQTQQEEAIYVTQDHPIVHFVKFHQDILSPTTSDMIHHEKAGHYELTRDFYERVCAYFCANIKMDLRPTRFDEAEFTCNKLPKGDELVSFVVQLDYLLVMPGEGKMSHKEIKL